MPNTLYLLDEANGVHSRTASPSAQERCLRQGLGRRLSPDGKTLFLFSFLFLSKALSAIIAIISLMCDYMYYEQRQRGKLKNLVPAEEPELEKVEEQPMTVKA